MCCNLGQPHIPMNFNAQRSFRRLERCVYFVHRQTRSAMARKGERGFFLMGHNSDGNASVAKKNVQLLTSVFKQLGKLADERRLQVLCVWHIGYCSNSIVIAIEELIALCREYVRYHLLN